MKEGEWYEIKCPKCGIWWLAEMHPPIQVIAVVAAEGEPQKGEWAQYLCKEPMGCGYIINVDDDKVVIHQRSGE